MSIVAFVSERKPRQNNSLFNKQKGKMNRISGENIYFSLAEIHFDHKLTNGGYILNLSHHFLGYGYKTNI